MNLSKYSRLDLEHLVHALRNGRDTNAVLRAHRASLPKLGVLPSEMLKNRVLPLLPPQNVASLAMTDKSMLEETRDIREKRKAAMVRIKKCTATLLARLVRQYRALRWGFLSHLPSWFPQRMQNFHKTVSIKCRDAIVYAKVKHDDYDNKNRIHVKIRLLGPIWPPKTTIRFTTRGVREDLSYEVNSISPKSFEREFLRDYYWTYLDRAFTIAMR